MKTYQSLRELEISSEFTELMLEPSRELSSLPLIFSSIQVGRYFHLSLQKQDCKTYSKKRKEFKTKIKMQRKRSKLQQRESSIHFSTLENNLASILVKRKS